MPVSRRFIRLSLKITKLLHFGGKAEEVAPQAKQIKSFAYPFLAKAYANDKVQSKLTRGYEVVLVA